MFGWLKKNEKQVPVENIASAHELGRSAAESAIADIEAYMQARFYPHIQKIADDAFGDFESPDLPPLVLARIDLKNFVEDVDEYVRPTVFPQLRSAVAGWINTMNQAGVGAEFERLKG
jgi:inhibitor of KinA sporulation pathway (predicted exonuclease)